MGRIMSIWLPQLPLDRRKRLSDSRLDGPFAIIREIKNAYRLTHISSASQALGLTPGLSLADARAICPDLLTENADPLRERALLRALWRWADKLSPQIAIDEPDGLLLNITGCSHLFGGEDAMARFARDELSRMNIVSRIAIADTKIAARALAEFSKSCITRAADGGTKQALYSIPIEGLLLEPNTCSELKRSGLKTIGDLQRHKTSELARRFGLKLVKNYNAAMGHTPDPVLAQNQETIFAARMTLPDPIGFKSDLMAVLEKLVGSVCSRLETSLMGGRRFKLTVRCVDTGDHTLSVGFARPCFDTKTVIQQFMHPLDNLKVEYGADWFRLVAENLEPLQFRQLNIVQGGNRPNDEFDKMVTTLGNRLGFDRVRRFTPQNSHVPEKEYRSIEAVEQSMAQKWPETATVRPERFFLRPERINPLRDGRPPQTFQWRKQVFETSTVLGPDRLTPDWWRPGDKRTRDYWSVRTKEGSCFWLMTYPASTDPEWFIAGRFV